MPGPARWFASLLVLLTVIAGPIGCETAARVESAAAAADELVYLTRSLEAEDEAALRSTAPNLRIVTGLTAEEALAMAPEVDAIDGRYATPEFLAAASRLRWVQSPSAGVERYIAMPEIRNAPDLTLTNMRTVHGPTIAEHSFAMLLVLTRDLRYHLDAATTGTWNRSGSGTPPIALEGRTLLVVGLGGIGREVARKGKGLGMTVLATRRSDRARPEYVDEQGRADALPAFLPRADVVVLAVPLTDETEGMIDAETLARFKPGSYLVNVARGRVVDTDALVAALESGHLAGACLDVTDPEPLPSDHVLWRMPNVVITPHVSSRSELTRERWRSIYVENLRRFAVGEPLMNVVDTTAGY